MNVISIKVTSLPLRKRGKDSMGAIHMKLTDSLAVTTALLFLSLTSALAEKPRIYTANPLDAGVAYNQRARDAYAAGVWTLEEIENDAYPSTHTTAEARRGYARALQAFAEAVNAEPSMYEAHTYIGYANRKLGNYEEALVAYDTALKLKADYVFAIEYQGEAYLGLNDFARAKFNYLRLYALDKQLASKLLEAMRDWVESSDAQHLSTLGARDWIQARMPTAAR
jgi:tetratricopeptide (TPR) repeat protein